MATDQSKLVPTDEMLDEHCALAVGWLTQGDGWLKGRTRFSGPPPYCADWHHFDEIAEYINLTGCLYEFLQQAAREFGEEIGRDDRVIKRPEVPPRPYVIAALKAFGRWPENWRSK